MSFYRIYRPKVLEEIDNKAVRETVELLLTKPKNQLPHAYLLVGPKGTGKTTTARVIAKLFNCERPSKKRAPCGSCEQCKAIAAGSHLDVMEIDAASNTGVDNIRDLRDAIALSPLQGAWKIYIIDEVHMLSTGAFNALLKTLEEPPSHAIFLLATTDPQKIPATVTSRCQIIPFDKAQTDDLLHALTRIVQKESMTIDDDALAIIANYADGSFRDGVKMLEHVSFQKGTITAEVVYRTLAISHTARREEFLAHLLARRAKEALADVQALVTQGRDIKTFLVDCLMELERRLVTNQTSELREPIRRLGQAYAELRTSPIPQLPLELAVVEYSEDEEHGNSSVILANPSERLRAGAGIQSTKKWTPNRVGGDSQSAGLLTLEKLDRHWRDVIDEMKPFNHSVAGAMRSTRPKAVEGGIVVVEAFYPFHQEKLSESKTRDAIAAVLKKLFGEKVKVEVVLGKK